MRPTRERLTLRVWRTFAHDDYLFRHPVRMHVRGQTALVELSWTGQVSRLRGGEYVQVCLRRRAPTGTLEGGRGWVAVVRISVVSTESCRFSLVYCLS